MTIATRNLLLSVFFATAVVACGGGGGGGDEAPADPGTNPGGTGPGDVSVDQLNGTWFGTFDDRNTVRTMQLVAENGNITGISLEGVATNLSGPITKVTSVPRAFKFELRNQDTPPQVISSGTLFVAPGATHLMYLDQFFNVGTIQKGATAVPSYAQADVNQAWASGDNFTTNTGFTTFTQRGASATCTSVNATTSECTVTNAGGAPRAASQLSLDNPRGRYLGTYTDTPATGSPSNGTTRIYLSPDKNFAGVWNCTDFGGGFPGTCDFSTWKR